MRISNKFANHAPIIAWASIVVCVVAGADFAHAALGGSIDTLKTEALEMKAASQPRMQTAAGYTIVETTLQSGTVVRQYAAPGGTVFGVTWSGPYMPNLHKLLGTSFDSLTGHQSGPKGAGLNALQVREDNLVIESYAHMHAYSGRAYLPRNFPSGVTPGVLR
jgi:hypothetical protein